MIIIHLNPDKEDKYMFKNKNRNITITDATIKRMDDRREAKLLLFFEYENKQFKVVDNLYVDEDCGIFYKNLEKAYEANKSNEDNERVVFCYKQIIFIAEGKIQKDSNKKGYIIDNISMYDEEVYVRTKKSKSYGNINVIKSNDNKDIFQKLPSKKSNKLSILFENYKEEKDNNTVELDKQYVNSMVKMYYDYLVEFCNNYNKADRPNKLSGIMSYIALKNFINEEYKNKFEISNPNCYIKNYSQEFDALLLKQSKNKSKYTSTYIYDEEDVIAIFELKTGGVMYNTNYFQSNFVKGIIIPYLSNNIINLENLSTKLKEKYQKDNEKFSWEQLFAKPNTDFVLAKDILKQIKKCKVNNQKKQRTIPFIYFASHERASKKAYDFYEKTYDIIEKYNTLCNEKDKDFPKIYTWIATTKKSENKFCIPLEKHRNIKKDLDEICKNA